MKWGIWGCLVFVSMTNAYITTNDANLIKNNKDLVVKQKFVLEILRHVYQPLQFAEYLVHGKMFVYDEINYTNWPKIIEFMEIYKTKLLPRGKVFSIINQRHIKEVKSLFDLFYYSKDWVVFQKNVIWARMHVNQEMFIHALMAAILHRDDMVGIVIPSPYEIMPFKFFTADVMAEGMKWKLQKRPAEDTTYVIWNNFTFYDSYVMNSESKINYFTEDIGLNTFYYFYQMDRGFWLGDKDVLIKDKMLLRRGEEYLFLHQQLLARYYLERLSNDLGDIPEIDWVRPLKTGYFPNLRYYNGMNFPMRQNNFLIQSLTKRDLMIQKVMDYERRLRDVIDTGIFVVGDKRIDIRDAKSIDILGNIISSNGDSFGRSIEIYARLLLGGSVYTGRDYRLVPSVLEHFETSLRDPVFYQLYKRIIKLYWQFKDKIKVYTKDQLWMKGVEIQNVYVSRLVTYFDYFDSDITNAIDIMSMNKMDYNNKWDMNTWDTNKWNTNTANSVKSTQDINVAKMTKDTGATSLDLKDMDMKTDWQDMRSDLETGVINDEMQDNTWKYLIKVRQLRLNHVPFNVILDITSDKDQKVVIRSFIGPKRDEMNRLFTLDEIRANFIELDKFLWDLKVGKNMIKRTSRAFFHSASDGTTYTELYKRVMTMGINDLLYANTHDFYCGFPDRLVMPKGKVGGMDMQMFFIVTPYTAVKDTTIDKSMCGTGRFIDDLPLGYPFDRKIDFENLFFATNMMFKDVILIHNPRGIKMNYII